LENLKSLRQQKKTRGRKTEDSFQVVHALVQRGKGGVYQAIDFSSTPPRLCLLKEGRKLGEVGWDGRDGAWRVRHEETVLSKLAGCGLSLPKIYSRFELQGNFYLVMEFIDGESLHNLLLRRARRLPVARVLSYGVQIATLLEHMHRAGWTWRDCKPKNLIVTSDGRLVPIDFEGAAPIKRPDPVLWGTRGFIPATTRKRKSNGVSEDLFALGAILYLLLTGRVFDETDRAPIHHLRKNVPLEVRTLVESLLANTTSVTPAVTKQLNSIFLQTTRSKAPMNRQFVKAA
jgi:serine/threonine protein kinase